jgi:hypothetical protein
MVWVMGIDKPRPGDRGEDYQLSAQKWIMDVIQRMVA